MNPATRSCIFGEKAASVWILCECEVIDDNFRRIRGDWIASESVADSLLKIVDEAKGVRCANVAMIDDSWERPFELKGGE